MTKELILLPFEGSETVKFSVNFSHTVLRLCGFVQSVDSNIGNKLRKITEKAIQNKQYVPKDFTSYLCGDVDEETGFEELHYGETIIDPYGDPIVYVFVKDLLELEELHREYYKHEEHHINKEKALGTMAYIKTLPKNRKIALYWN